MTRDKAPDKNCACHDGGVDSGFSRHGSSPDSAEMNCGSHVMPVAPPVEPTDPFSTRGPLSTPPSWLPLGDGDSTVRDSDNPGPPSSRELLELYAQVEAPRPRDTLPSPPPNPDDTDSVPPPTIVDHL